MSTIALTQRFKNVFLAFIQLRMNPNPLFKRLTSSMLPALKNHLETTLSGACFSALRSLGPLMTRPSKHIFTECMFLQGADAGDAFLWEVSQFFTQEHLCRFVKELTSVSRLLLKCFICKPEDLQNVPDDPGSHEDRARYQQIKVGNFSLFATMINVAINDGPPSLPTSLS